ncbi:UvrD-helicase domain-containing protein [Vibrio parahaemolyticus]|uniref:UvrD-helicase domain-containing protein n=2 Tax=Vibrio parahaemolyticus TaxID=670 RepID=UPI00186A139E|nr:UvrD-helicase domain-containing protein [Vibrio parahaemolyticus]EME0095020.1 UvrD-helicase domain-containing protein [Vibrio parahaemolyticus]MBE3764828.1 ATP-dependent helicase [Vibrio parahaemolyticus]MDF5472197.1 UvrD-helicase domain-containing protein [Vibrio parahaemolyticus]HCG5905960.1 UvrD-helicase domain-containing protein [Vibrio parahaemolyticus]HCH1030291.1 UvrD-helicase domain-containing protein [Vibrio parahaemolyticus]
MIEIQIAGAGAGKTYGLAKTLIDHIKACTSHKKTFALTYTNSATAKIEQEIIKQHGFIPSNLCIQTVHSFLLNEIIYPFSSFTLGDVYNDTSIMISNPKYKNGLFARLRKMNVIHTDNVYNIAKQIVDETVSKHNNKAKKAKVRRLLTILGSCFDKIFIDEVQDLDKDALRFFEVLGSNNIDVYMIGDPKQAIKFPQDLDAFVKKVAPKEYATILPINNQTRRVPTEILAVSNSFCYEDQQQESLSEEVGELMYIESTDGRYDELLTNYIDTKQLVCIDKKNGRYTTSSKHKHAFPREIEEMIRDSNHKKDKALFVKAAFSDFMDDIAEVGARIAINRLKASHDLTLNKQHFAQLYELCNSCAGNDVQFKVQSIESIKGLDADVCVIILSPNTLKYLTQNGISKANRFNKEWKKIYVALTRAKKRLVLALDHDLLAKEDMAAVRDSIGELGFVTHN